MGKNLGYLKERIAIAGDETPLDLSEAAAFICKSKSWFYRAERAGKIKLMRIGARGTRVTYGQVRALTEPRLNPEAS